MRLWLLLWSLICSRTPVSICFIVVKLRASSHGWKRWKPSEPNGAGPVTSVTPTFPIVIVWGNHKNISSVRTCPHWSKLQLELVTPPQWKTLNIDQIKYALYINVWYLWRICKGQSWVNWTLSMTEKVTQQLWIVFRLGYIWAQVHLGIKMHQSQL